ncbi:MAG: ATP-binding protein [Gammaproteobacteria bacterium]|nr:ATP-binding protein [Gammaproteobacteria bacterium]
MMGKHWTVVQVPAQAERLHALRSLVHEQATAYGFMPGCVDDLVLAVNEACMNVIQHGYRGAAGLLELGVSTSAEGIEFRIRDHAATVTLDDWRPRDLDDLRPGGLGVHFIRQIMDEVAYLPTPDGTGNLLSLKKHRPGRETAS